jgi:hypothetical protein
MFHHFSPSKIHPTLRRPTGWGTWGSALPHPRWRVFLRSSGCDVPGTVPVVRLNHIRWCKCSLRWFYCVHLKRILGMSLCSNDLPRNKPCSTKVLGSIKPNGIKSPGPLSGWCFVVTTHMGTFWTLFSGRHRNNMIFSWSEPPEIVPNTCSVSFPFHTMSLSEGISGVRIWTVGMDGQAWWVCVQVLMMMMIIYHKNVNVTMFALYTTIESFNFAGKYWALCD